MKRYFLLMSLLMLANAQAGELYRSIDSSGKVHYSDRPLPESQDVEELKVDKAPPPDDSLPYAVQRAKENFPITLYAFEKCGSLCEEAREFLQKRGIPFDEKNLVSQEDIDAFHKASGGAKVPSITVGKNWLKGFSADAWNKELDFAGYPKNAPYRPAKPVPAPSAQPAN